jgi:hypothetical protein
MAKTYTMIKDKVGKSAAPLDTFLRLACPKMGIIPVSDYLEMLNWVVTYENGDLTVNQVGRPNLSAFDRDLLCCSLNHIDLLQFVLDNKYLQHVNGVIKDMRNYGTHMLVCAPTMDRDDAQKAFSAAISNDPKAVAAQIFGLDVNHMFLEISSNTYPDADTRPYQLPILADSNPAPTQQPQQMMGPYPWTGSMSELYKPDEMQLDLEAIMEMDEWIVTDISNPVDMDNFLETVGGYNPDQLFPGRKYVQVVQMKLADHSQSSPSPP